METPAPDTAAGPRAEYIRRGDQWKVTHALYDTRHRQLGIANLALGALVLALIGLALVARLVSVLWVVPPLSAIVVLAILHDRVMKKREHASRTAAYYERALARIDNRWMGRGDSGERFQDESHPYSRDLDLFGAGSLFELLCAARTHVGQQTLARWLLAPAAPVEVRARQEAVGDLRNRLDLRENIAVLAEESLALAPAEALAAWGEGSPLPASRLLRWASALLAGLWLASLAVWMVWGLAYVALLVTAINLIVYTRYRQRMHAIVSAADSATAGLALLAGVLGRLENERFAAPPLVALEAALKSQGWPPSRWIARLRRRMEYLDSRRNLFISSIDPFVHWTFQCACAIESWRRQAGPSVRRWLAAVGEFEALSSLAGYAYERPADVFPEFTAASPCFDAEGLAHPLLAEGEAVRNDLSFGQSLRVLIVSGPNMAGKSTFVRAVGINAVLAQCGAPVRARRLRLSPLAVGASICVLDSLQGGISRFYAEIRRLKQIVDLTQGTTAVLFLLDEFLGGTNSQDRRVGSEAMVRRLVERGAIGLVTTHDLALAKIADGLGARALNVHFQDSLADGKLVFDYRLRPGIVESSNALNLMRSIGLDV